MLRIPFTRLSCVVFSVLASNAALGAEAVNGCPIRSATLCVEFDLRAAPLSGADLARAEFRKSELSAADLSGANLVEAELDLTRLNRANLSGANLERADMQRVEAYGANLRGARLTGANMHSADFSGANFDGAQMAGANLSGAHLAGAGMRSTNLQRANLTGALLSQADLRGADLSGAVLSQATLTGADLTGARLTGAVFDGAWVEGCKGCPPVESARAQVLGGIGNVSAGATRAPHGVATAAALPPAPPVGSGCWARLYQGERYGGEALTLVGPAEVANLATDWGFKWEPRFHSVVVGPRATLQVFDNTQFRDRTATFKAGQHLPQLNDTMGIFRNIRSVRVSCPA